MSLKNKFQKHNRRGKSFSTPPQNSPQNQADASDIEQSDISDRPLDTFQLLPLRDMIVFPYMIALT